MNSDFEITTSAVCGPSLNAGQSAASEGKWTTKSTSSACSCSRCWTISRAWITSTLGVSIILIAYLTLGAVMFVFIGNNYETRSQQRQWKENEDSLANYDPDGRLEQKTLATVDRLWSITEDLNILYRENWTSLAQIEMLHYQQQIVRALRKAMLEERYSIRQTWTFPMAILYALTLVTTIGFGFYTPSSLLARCLTVAYSIIGIPLFLLYLSVAGERLARAISEMTCRCLCCCCCCYDNNRAFSRNRRLHQPFQYGDVADVVNLQSMSRMGAGQNGHMVPIDSGYDDFQQMPIKSTSSWPPGADKCCRNAPLIACLVLMTAYIAVGSVVMSVMQDLSYVESVHLIFNLLLTLGFGTLLAGMSAEDSETLKGDAADAHQVSLIVITVYVVVGMTLLASCFNILLDTRSSKSVTYHYVPSLNSRLSQEKLS